MCFSHRKSSDFAPPNSVAHYSEDGTIAYAFLEPDYKKRAEPEDVLKVLEIHRRRVRSQLHRFRIVVRGRHRVDVGDDVGLGSV